MGTIQIDGSTPKLTIGNATAEDALILFDGNAQDFYIGLDDSADDLIIGLGSAVGTTPAISINEDRDVTISDGAIDFDVASHDGSNGLKLGGTLVTTTAAEINLIDGGTSRGTTALADGDGILINDAGTMRMTNVTAVKTYMAGSNAVTALNNATANELVTVGSTTTELDCESTLTFNAASDPPLFYCEGNIELRHNSDAPRRLILDGDRAGEGNECGIVEFKWNNTAIAKIAGTAGADTTNKDEGNIDFSVIDAGGSYVQAMHINRIGAITKPKQPAFLNQNASAQSNLAINAWTTLTFATEVFDQNADFNVGTHTFTAPISGRYLFSCSLQFDNLDNDSTYWQFQLKTSNREYANLDSGNQYDANPTNLGYAFSIIADMDADDTAYMRFYQGGGTAEADLRTESFFSGALLC